MEEHIIMPQWIWRVIEVTFQQLFPPPKTILVISACSISNICMYILDLDCPFGLCYARCSIWRRFEFILNCKFVSWRLGFVAWTVEGVELSLFAKQQHVPLSLNHFVDKWKKCLSFVECWTWSLINNGHETIFRSPFQPLILAHSLFRCAPPSTVHRRI